MSEPSIIKGFDFASAPKRSKPITCAYGVLAADVLEIDGVARIADFETFEAALQEPGPWIAGFDFPFSLPRIFLESVGWSLRWEQLVSELPRMGATAFKSAVRNYCDAHPEGSKHPRRRTDELANSCSPLMLDYTPVAKMFFQASWRIAAAGLSVTPCRVKQNARVAVEAYPALVARRWIKRASYKSDRKQKHTADQAAQRKTIVDALRGDRVKEAYGFSIAGSSGLWEECVADPSADLLDAVLCCVQAAWAQSQGEAYGIPPDVDSLEGWIVDPSMVLPNSSRSARIDD